MTPPTPARRDAATGDTPMRTQEPPMTEHDTTDAIVTIRSALYQWVPDGDLAPAIHAIDALAGRLAAAEAGTRRCTYGWCARNALTVRIDGLASRLVAAEAERDEARARIRRLRSAVLHHTEHRAADMGRWQHLSGPEINQLARDLANGAGLHAGDLTDGSDDDFSDDDCAHGAIRRTAIGWVCQTCGSEVNVTEARGDDDAE